MQKNQLLKKNNHGTKRVQLFYWLELIAFGILLLLLTASIPSTLNWNYDRALLFNDPEHKLTAGEYGDIFGLSNAVFSAISVWLLLITIYLQRMELRESRAVAQQSKDEFESQTAIFEQQSELISLQQFEGEFFKLLSLLANCQEAKTLQGETFNKCIQDVFINSELGTRGERDLENRLAMYLKNIHAAQGYMPALIRFWKTFQVLVAFVEHSKSVDEEKKKFYHEIVRSQITSFEAKFLAYLATECPATKTIIEKYSIINSFLQDTTSQNGIDSHVRKKYQLDTRPA